MSGLAAAVASRLGLRSRVNCWFCAADARVPFESRNSWTCGGCSQYNGFASDGDYNRELPEQRYEALNPRPDQLRPRPDKVTDEEGPEEAGNGLCAACNRSQTLKVAQVGRLEEEDEGALAAAKARLERIHRLCPPCEARTQAHLRSLHARLRLPDPKAPYLPTSPKTPSSLYHPRRGQLRSPPPRSKWASVGWACRGMQAGGFLLALALCLGSLQALEADSRTPAVDLASRLPLACLAALDYVSGHGLALSLYGAGLHGTACWANQARLITVDLLLGAAWALMAALFARGAETPSEVADRLLFLAGAGTLVTLLAFWALVLPRKRVRSSRSKLGGAVSLSVASTPESQCTTAFLRSPASPDSPMETGASPPQPMDISVSDDEGTFKVPNGPVLRKRSGTPKRGREGTPGREATPSRVLASQMGSGLSIADEDDDACSIYSAASSASRRRGPFSSISFPAGAPPPRPDLDSLFRPGAFGGSSVGSSVGLQRQALRAPSMAASPVFSAPKFRPAGSTAGSSSAYSSCWTSVSRQGANPRWSPGQESRLSSVSERWEAGGRDGEGSVGASSAQSSANAPMSAWAKGLIAATILLCLSNFALMWTLWSKR